LPSESIHFRKATDASTLAGDEVFGSLSKEIILNRTVLLKSVASNKTKQTVLHKTWKNELNSQLTKIKK
jgi:hypothetical protein